MKNAIKTIKALLKLPYFYIVTVCVIALIVGAVVLVNKNKHKDEPEIGGLEVVEDGEDVEDEDVIDFSEFEEDDKDSDKNQADDNKDDNKEDNNDKDDDKDNNNDKEDDNKEPDKKDGGWGKFF